MSSPLQGAATPAPASAFSLPLVPPGQDACRVGWQTGQRVTGIDAGAAYVIDAQFDQAQAAGRLLRRSLAGAAGGGAGGGAITLGPPLWDAGALLDAGQPPPAARRIFTSSASGATMPFAWPALDPGQRSVLDSGEDGLGEARLDYLRGERSREGAPFRRRAALLGEMVRSAPLLVGAPSTAQQGPAYAAFYQQYRDRPKLVYVGANDGMLHAFGWDDGIERFAFIPAALLPALPQLALEGAAPRAYVDGSPAQGEVLVDGQWRTALVSGMGMGARGVFALDVTDSAGDPRVLWEFTQADDAAIGHIHAPPLIIKLRIGGEGTPAYRYFALIASGLDPVDGGSDGALFLLALDKPPSDRWQRGVNYFRLAAASGAPSSANALAPPVVVLAGDGSAHSAYAGDLQGIMWRFDLAGLAAAAGSAKGEGNDDVGHARVAALFHARGPNGASQLIADAARVVFAPGGGYLVLFGTGRSAERGDIDPANFVQQSFYAVRDSDAHPLLPVAGRRALAERRMTGEGDAYRLEGEAFDYNGEGAGVKQGWYFDYPRALADGESSAGPPQLSGSAVVIVSTAPGTTPCAPALRAYVLDTLTGLGFDRLGMPGQDVVTGRRMDGGDDRPASAEVFAPLLMSRMLGTDAPTPTGAIRSWRSLGLFQLSAAGAALPLDEITLSTPAGRRSWREISNWNELHEAAGRRSP
ncbi:MAG: pilus assembly protein [Massilia sp.]